MLRATSRQKGVAAIEFAFAAIVLIFLFFGIYDFGRAFHQYNTLLKVTRSAARELTFGTHARHWPRAHCLAVYGEVCRDHQGDDTTCAAAANPPAPLVAGLSCALVQEPAASASDACVEIRGFEFVPLLSWVAPNFQFHPLKTCMRR